MPTLRAQRLATSAPCRQVCVRAWPCMRAGLAWLCTLLVICALANHACRSSSLSAPALRLMPTCHVPLTLLAFLSAPSAQALMPYRPCHAPCRASLPWVCPQQWILLWCRAHRWQQGASPASQVAAGSRCWLECWAAWAAAWAARQACQAQRACQAVPPPTPPQAPLLPQAQQAQLPVRLLGSQGSSKLCACGWGPLGRPCQWPSLCSLWAVRQASRASRPHPASSRLGSRSSRVPRRQALGRRHLVRLP